MAPAVMPDTPATLVDGHIKVQFLTVRPVGWLQRKVTLAEILAGKEGSFKVLKSDFDLKVDKSDRITGQEPVGQKASSEDLGPSKATGGYSIIRYLGEDGKPVPEDDDIYAMHAEKGTMLYAVVRRTADAEQDWAEDDEIECYQEVMDNLTPGPVTGSNIVWRCDPAIKDFFVRGTIAPATP